MNRKHTTTLLSIALSVGSLSACGDQTVTAHLTLSNPPKGSDIPQLMDIPWDQAVRPGQGYQGQQAVEALAIDTNNDGQTDHLRVLASLAPSQTLQVRLSPVDSLTDRAHAELSVRTGGQWQDRQYQAEGFSFETVRQFQSPEQLTDHSYFLRYEGPGWESDQMGYRLYLDWRNAIDVFGKKVTGPVLPQVGQDGYDSYHQMQDWGMDLLKAGKSLGLGALGRLVDDEVVHFQQVDSTSYQLQHDDALSASFTVSYQGWQVGPQRVDVQTRYLIHGGDGATDIRVTTSEVMDNLVTGLVKHGVQFIKSQGQDWGYVATWGRQSLAGEQDELGLAIFYRRAQLAAQTEAQHDYLLRFIPTDQEIRYQILAVWPQHPQGVKDQQGFEQLLQDKLAALDHPLQIRR